MQPSELEVGQLYVCQTYPGGHFYDRCSPGYKRDYGGKPAVYMGLQPRSTTLAGARGAPLWLANHAAYKLFISGELRYVPDTFLKHLKKVLDNPVKAC